MFLTVFLSKAFYSPFVTFFIALLFILICLVIISRLKRSRYSEIVGQQECSEPLAYFPSLWFTGGVDYIILLIPHIRRHRFADYVLELFDQLGSTFVHTVLHQHIVHTINPENLKALLSTNAQDYNVISPRSVLTRTIYGEGIFATNGEEWKQSRSYVRQAMSAMTYDIDTFERHASSMVQDLKSQGSDTVDFLDVGWRYTTDLTFDLFFGESTRSPDKAQALQAVEMTEAFAYLGNAGRSVTLFGKRLPAALDLFYRGWRVKKLAVESFVARHLLEARHSKELDVKHNHGHRRKLVDAIADTDADLTRAKAEIMNLMLAGGDTTAVALVEVVWLLARHPQVWAKLRAEVQSVFGGRQPTLSKLKKLDYLKCILNESLRLRPTLSVHGRLANRPTILPRGGGPSGNLPILVPARSYVLYSYYALNRNPAVFGPDVEDFRPERWQALQPDRYEFLGFGGGTRACPGERMGKTMCAHALVRLAQKFERLEARDEREWEEEMAFSFSNRHGCKVAFGNRQM